MALGRFEENPVVTSASNRSCSQEPRTNVKAWRQMSYSHTGTSVVATPSTSIMGERSRRGFRRV